MNKTGHCLYNLQLLSVHVDDISIVWLVLLQCAVNKILQFPQCTFCVMLGLLYALQVPHLKYFQHVTTHLSQQSQQPSVVCYMCERATPDYDSEHCLEVI